MKKSQVKIWRTVHTRMRGYRASQILMTCNHLGIFRHLAGGSRRGDEIADFIGSHPEACRRLLNAAVALGLLTKTGGAYANSQLAAACLAKEGPFFLGNMARFEQATYERWSRLPEAIATGRWPESNRRMEERTQWVRNFEMAMYDMARTLAPLIAEVLPLPTRRPLQLLDVGGGPGGYSMALARRYPRLTATVLELPEAAEVARETIAAEGLARRVEVQSGDFQRQELGQGYDVVLIFGVLVSETDEGKRALLRKAHAALVPGGLLVIREFWLNPEDPARSPEAALFSLHMLLANSAGDVVSLAEMKSMLAEAGFERIRRLQLPAWVGSTLCLARKPGPGPTPS
jgi:2-polyprenyl-3-methyl-5-hydroxy-6-metoxy-1,4-benzoquinol methylase